MGLLLALVHIVESLVWFTAIIFATQFARRFLKSPKFAKWIDRGTGGVLIGFGGVLAWEARV
jgi:threonine/homoserine/homoserine lactone efflux protein